MHLVHPDKLPQEIWEGFPFKTLLDPSIGGRLGVYLLTIKESNPHLHDDLDQIYIVIKGSGWMDIDGLRLTECGGGIKLHGVWCRA